MLAADMETEKRMAAMFEYTLFYPVHLIVSQANRVSNIFQENTELRRKVNRLKLRVAELEKFEKENTRLRSMLDLKPEFKYEIVTARCIAREPSHTERTIIIHAGKNDSIEEFMPVVTSKGIVGKILQPLPRISLVQLISDPSMKVSVMNKNTRGVGILETETGRDFFIKYRKHEEVSINDTLITSGLGGVFPKGIDVGVVTGIKEMTQPLFKKIIVKPFADLDKLEEVFVLHLSPRWSGFRAELDSITTTPYKEIIK